MAEPIGALRADLSADAVQFEKDMGRARKAVRKTTHDAKSNFKAFRLSSEQTARSIKGLRVAIGALVAAFAVGRIKAFIDGALSAADSIDKVSQKSGVGVRALQEWRFAASQSGLATRDLDDAVTRLNRRVGLFVTQGGGPAVNAIKQLGLNVRDSAGNIRSTEDIFAEAIDKLSGIEDSARRAALASQLFGEDAGPRLVPLLNQGRDGIEALRQKARDLGLVMDEAMIKKAVEAKDKMDALGDVLRAKLNVWVAENAEDIANLADALLEALPKVLRFINSVSRALGLTGPLKGLARDAADFDILANARRRLSAPATGGVDQFQLSGKLLDAIARQTGISRDKLITSNNKDIINNIDRALGQLGVKQANRFGNNAVNIFNSLRKSKKGDFDTEIKKINKGGGKKSVSELATELERANAASARLLELYGKAPDTVRSFKDEIELQNAAVSANVDLTTEQGKRWAAAYREGQQLKRNLSDVERIVSETRTPLEEYNERMERLRELTEAGAISQDTFKRAAERAKRQLDDQSEAVQRAKDLARGLAQSFGSAFEEAVISGKKFSDVLQGLQQDLMRLAMNRLFTAPLVKGFESLIGGLFSPAGGGQSGLGGLLGFATGGSFTVGGRPGIDRNLVAFRASRGERVSVETPAQQADGAPNMTVHPGDVTVNVYAPEGSQVEQRETNGPGGRTIEIMIDEAVANNIGTPGSRTSRALKSTFGANPTLKGRG